MTKAFSTPEFKTEKVTLSEIFKTVEEIEKELALIYWMLFGII